MPPPKSAHPLTSSAAQKLCSSCFPAAAFQDAEAAATAWPAPHPAEEGARSRLAQKIPRFDRRPAAYPGCRSFGPPGEEEKEGGLTAFLSSGGASCRSPLRKPTLLACSCASHAAAAYSRAGSREERHRVGGCRCCAPSRMSTSTYMHTCPQTCENKNESVTARPRAEGADSKKSQNEQRYSVHKQCGHRALCGSNRGMGIAIPAEQSDRSRCSYDGARYGSTTRGRHITAVGARAAIRFPSFPQMGKVESDRSFTVGITHDFSGIQAPIRRCPSPFLWRNTVTSSNLVSFESSLC